MKRTLLVITLALFLTSCGMLPQENSASPANQRERQEIQPQSAPTATYIPTPTVDYIATVQAAQSTAEAANKLMVEATAAEDQRQHIELSWTAIADQATITAAALTAQSDLATANAVPTYIGPTMTAQVENMHIAKVEAENARSAFTATAAAPTHIVAVAQAEAIADFADDVQRADIGVRWAIGFFLFAFAIFLLVGSLLRAQSGSTPRPQPEAEDDQETDPHPNLIRLPQTSKDQGAQWALNYNTIPCTTDQLFELADGVINRGMSLSFNIWEGTIVHKSLKKIRDFFVDRQLGKNIKNSNGMMDLTPEGESLLRHVAEHGSPPPPFVCLPETA